FLAVEVGDLARPQHVELQDVEVLAYKLPDVGARKVDEMGLATVGAAAQLPDHGKMLAVLARRREVLGQFEEAFDEPRFAIEAVIGHHRFGARARSGGQDRAGRQQHMASREHQPGSAPLKAAFGGPWYSLAQAT